MFSRRWGYCPTAPAASGNACGASRCGTVPSTRRTCTTPHSSSTAWSGSRGRDQAGQPPSRIVSSYLPCYNVSMKLCSVSNCPHPSRGRGLCVKHYQAWYYRQTRPEAKRYLYRNRANLSAFLAWLKVTAGCAQCGYDRHYAALDFDHIRGEKKFSIGWSRAARGIKNVLDEVRKCQVLCSNCHRLKTWYARR